MAAEQPFVRGELAAAGFDWQPSPMGLNFCYQPLYFEEVNAERYGHTFGILQPPCLGSGVLRPHPAIALHGIRPAGAAARITRTGHCLATRSRGGSRSRSFPASPARRRKSPSFMDWCCSFHEKRFRAWIAVADDASVRSRPQSSVTSSKTFWSAANRRRFRIDPPVRVAKSPKR